LVQQNNFGQTFFAHDAKVSKRHNKCLIGLGGLHFWKIVIEWCFQNNASIGFHYGEQIVLARFIVIAPICPF
jgi:hypothetical protein